MRGTSARSASLVTTITQCALHVSATQPEQKGNIAMSVAFAAVTNQETVRARQASERNYVIVFDMNQSRSNEQKRILRRKMLLERNVIDAKMERTDWK